MRCPICDRYCLETHLGACSDRCADRIRQRRRTVDRVCSALAVGGLIMLAVAVWLI